MNSIIKTINGRGIPLPGSDIDTDRIIPARYLICVTFEGLGKVVFQDDRASLDGKHPFDLPQHQGANILIAGRNFGCGSSREHAPQALQRWGICAIIAESFAEIFNGNCVSLGLPCVTLPKKDLEELTRAVQSQPEVPLSIDLGKKSVFRAGVSSKCEMEPAARHQFLSGEWDSMGQLLADPEAIQECAGRLPYIGGF